MTAAAPAILSTWSFGPVANGPGMAILDAGGSALDAVVAAATAVENDPSINSVGIGGLPDADGRVSLDGCVMTDPNRCGSVAVLRRHANPCAIARRVMEKTIHVMLAGEGADTFADREGFPSCELLTPHAKSEWEKWAHDPRNIDRLKYQGWIPPQNVEEQARSGSGGTGLGFDRPVHRVRGGDGPSASHDTVSILAIDKHTHLAGACSTSGMAFKVPGRIGDSPIIGHGLYVDQQAGAAAATGNGELVMGTCGSFLAVELMRRGASPLDAILEVLRRISERFELGPDHQIAMIALAAPPRDHKQWGGWASAAIRPGFRHTITDGGGTRVEEAQRVLVVQSIA
jgi:isoaspartyl peptidase/L-asparaginase-like protein (Ntn-hydrolase superfamily)